MRDAVAVFVHSMRWTITAREYLRSATRVSLMLLVLGAAVRADAQTWRARADTTPHPATVDSNKVKIDSLTARLERAEAALELLRHQVETESATNIRTRSRLQIDLWARVLMNGFSNQGPLNSSDVPTMATNDTGPAVSAAARSLGFSLRQTRLGMSLFVDSVTGAQFNGDFELDFFGGGATSTTQSYLFPQPRLRTAKFTLAWPHTELLIGGETPLISDLNPVTVASVGVPGFSDAGNLWNWLPQVRVTRDLGVVSLGTTNVHLALQGALLHPFAGFELAGEEYDVDAGVRSGRPYLESRLRARWGADATPTGAGPGDAGGEVGIGVHHGWIHTGGDALTSTNAYSADARLGLPHDLELRGEAYTGRALAGLGGGGIGQNFGAPVAGAEFGPPLRDAGGWAQVNWRVVPTLLTGAGCGADVPDAAQHPERLRNESCAAHVMWRPAQPLLFGVELRELRTSYASKIARGRHLNFSFGFEL